MLQFSQRKTSFGLNFIPSPLSLPSPGWVDVYNLSSRCWEHFPKWVSKSLTWHSLGSHLYRPFNGLFLDIPCLILWFRHTELYGPQNCRHPLTSRASHAAFLSLEHLPPSLCLANVYNPMWAEFQHPFTWAGSPPSLPGVELGVPPCYHTYHAGF